MFYKIFNFTSNFATSFAGIALLAGAIFSPAEANTAPCREYQKNVIVGGEPQRAYGTACLQPDGSWQIVQEDSRLTTETFRTSRGITRGADVIHSAPHPIIVEEAPQVIYRQPHPRIITTTPAPSLFNITLGNWNRHFDGHYRHHRYNDRHFSGHRHHGRGHGYRHHNRRYEKAYRKGRRDGYRTARRHDHHGNFNGDFGRGHGRGHRGHH